MSHVDRSVETILRRDRALVLALLAVVMAASWLYILSGAGMGMSAIDMTRMSYMGEHMVDSAMAPAAWSPGYAMVMFLMWWIMMIAMMLPSATPMILLFAAVNRRRRDSGIPGVPTALFAASYLLAWGGFSLAATVLHWVVARAGLLTPGLVVNSQVLAAGILIAAGLYQFTPLKQSCLRHCRMPALYLATHARPGTLGALRLGLRHGAYCLGCCWVLMLLLFFGGVMNLYWIAGLAFYVLLEKTVPAYHWLGRGLGLMLLLAGSWMLLRAG